jgi:hypothetical protein
MNEYYLIGTQIYSETAHGFITSDNDDYVAWVAAGNVAPTLTGNDAIQFQIVRLEQTATPRRIREAFADATWIKALDAQIATLRAGLTP